MNALERIESQKVEITGDDVGRKTTHRQLQKLVILRVAARRYPHGNIDPLGVARQSREKNSNIFLIDIAAKLLSAYDFIQFGEHSSRKQNLSLLKCQIKCFSRV